MPSDNVAPPEDSLREFMLVLHGALLIIVRWIERRYLKR